MWRFILFLSIALPHLLFAEEGQRRNPFDMNKWIFTFTPFFGGVKSNLSVQYRVPYLNHTDNSLTMASGRKDLPGYGAGSGFQFAGIYKNWFLLSVNFDFPKSNHPDSVSIYQLTQNSKARITGSVNLFQYTWKNEQSWFEPFVGLGHFQGIGNHVNAKVKGFTAYSPEIQRYIYYPEQKVGFTVNQIFPQIGFIIKIPIQNWSISPFYSYCVEEKTTRIDTGWGTTLPYKEHYIDWSSIASGNANGMDPLLPVSLNISRREYNHRPGFNLYIDFRRFISLRVFVFRDITNHRWVVNGAFNVFFHKHFGIAAFMEYGERSIGTVRYWLIGPTFIYQF